MVVGPAGVAKTAAILEFFRDAGRPSCSIACTADTLSDGIVGSINPKVLLEQGTVEFISGPSLLNSELVHLDEFADLSDEIQTLVLGPLQPDLTGIRSFTRAGKRVELPLEMVIATGNSWPKREAVRDRFAIQIPAAPADVVKVLNWAIDRSTLTAAEPRDIWDDILQLREAALAVEIDPSLISAIALAQKEFKLTLRRVAQYVVKVLKVNAALEGRTVANFHDLAETLPFLVQASSMEEFDKASQWVRAKAEQIQADAAIAAVRKKVHALNRKKLAPVEAFKAFRELLREVGTVDPDACSEPSTARAFIKDLDIKVTQCREAVVSATLAEVETEAAAGE